MNPYKPIHTNDTESVPLSNRRISAEVLGMILGALPPAMYALWLIAASIEFDPKERAIPKCGTSAAVGILILMFVVPAFGAVGAALSWIISRLYKFGAKE